MQAKLINKTCLLGKWLLLASLLSILLAGCGFKLRQAPSVQGGEAVRVALPRDVFPLGPLLYEALEQYNFEYADEVRQSQISLDIIDSQFKRRTLTVNQVGRVAEYEFIISVSYRIQSASLGIDQVKQISERSNYAFDLAQVQAKDREQEELKTSLYRRLAQRIVRELALLNQ